MRNINICIVNRDIYYTNAFMRAVALDNRGFAVRVMAACTEDCTRDADVCLVFGAEAETARERCKKALEPLCGPYAGVSSLLSEARAFVYDNCELTGFAGMPRIRQIGMPAFTDGTLVCVFSCTGGVGVSCASIGIGRELARYRGGHVLYLSLEDAEDAGLFPKGLSAMRAEDVLYRYIKLENLYKDKDSDSYNQLFRSAAVNDEYGLYRLAPDMGVGSAAGLAPAELYIFLSHFAAALNLDRIVLDFGTKLGYVSDFASMLDEGEALFIEIVSDDEHDIGKRKTFLTETDLLTIALPTCTEDIRKTDGHTDIGLANSFGLSIKEICDQISGDMR